MAMRPCATCGHPFVAHGPNGCRCGCTTVRGGFVRGDAPAEDPIKLLAGPDDEETLATFRRRIRDEFLPQYLVDYGYEPGGYKASDQAVTPADAKWFLRALDEGVVTLLPKARLKLPASSVKAMIFWEHSRAVSPRPVGLHLEGVLSAGMAARLHFQYGWPIEQLGFEYPTRPGPGRRAFDLGALDGGGDLILAGEAKNERGELDHVLEVMQRCAEAGDHTHPKRHADQNGHNKWMGLMRCRPRVFFTYGPGEDWSVFEIAHGPDGRMSFREGPRELLRSPGPR